MYNYVLYYNIEKSGFNAVSASLVSKFPNFLIKFFLMFFEKKKDWLST